MGGRCFSSAVLQPCAARPTVGQGGIIPVETALQRCAKLFSLEPFQVLTG
jgi:hypothetical protein